MMKRLLFLLVLFASPAPVWAALSHSLLTASFSNSTVSNPSSYSTASVTCHANRLILLAVSGSTDGDSTPGTPTVAGCSATWVLVDNTADWGGAVTWVFRTMVGSDQTSAITITPNAGGIGLWQNAQWAVSEFDGVDTSGTNGSGAIVQHVPGFIGSSTNTFSITLSAFGNANNRPYMAIAGRICVGSQNFVPTGATEIADLDTAATYCDQMAVMWDASVADTTPTITWTDNDPDVAGVAIEIKASGGGGGTPSVRHRVTTQ